MAQLLHIKLDFKYIFFYRQKREIIIFTIAFMVGEKRTLNIKLGNKLGITQKTAWFMIDRLKGYDIGSLRETV